MQKCNENENNNNNKDDFLKNKKVKYSKKEYLFFKMEICRKYCQVHPYLLVSLPEAVRCSVCGNATYESAKISFVDRKKDGTEKQFIIERVCKDCLDETGLIYVTRNIIAKQIILQRGKVLFKGLFNGDRQDICYLCRTNNVTDVCDIRIKYKGLFINATLCEKHALKCHVSKSIDIDLSDAKVEQSIKEFSDSVDYKIDLQEEVNKFNKGYELSGEDLIKELRI